LIDRLRKGFKIMSDSSFVAVTRHRRPFSTAGRPHVLEVVDDEFAADKLGDDDIDTARHEVPLLEDGDLATDAIVSTGTSVTAANNAEERRKREQGWNDLALDQLDESTGTAASTTASSSNRNTGNGNQQ
jgi:hypothetical protein